MSTHSTVSTRTLWTELLEHGVQAMVQKISHEECMEWTEGYGTHNYHPLQVTVATGDGCYVKDANGKEYIDCIGSYSALAQGHLSEFIVKTTVDQLNHLTLTSRALYTRELALFLKALAEYTEFPMSCPMNSGAEAIETAIKIARKWGYTVKGIADNQAEIIVAIDNFHGRTVTIVSASSEPNYKNGFGPLTPGFKLVPFGDIQALKAAMTKNTCAILMEPIQAEAGILVPPDGFLAEVRRLCNQENVMLIWDEIQTGFCRTGKKFAWQHEEARPDMMCLGKALGGGLMPVSAVVGTPEAMGIFKPGDHGSTFGGNPLAAVIGIASMAELETSDLASNSLVMGQRLTDGLHALKNDAVQEVRGKGLLIGLEVREGTNTAKLQEAFLREGVLTKETRHRTFRLAPPLIITSAIVDDIVNRTRHALESV
jgi:ornithine--oxo-acid transaminase